MFSMRTKTFLSLAWFSVLTENNKTNRKKSLIGLMQLLKHGGGINV